MGQLVQPTVSVDRFLLGLERQIQLKSGDLTIP